MTTTTMFLRSSWHEEFVVYSLVNEILIETSPGVLFPNYCVHNLVSVAVADDFKPQTCAIRKLTRNVVSQI